MSVGPQVGTVVAVCSDSIHAFSKRRQESIRLLVGLGVEGDAHCGKTVQHRSRIAQDPSQPNWRQVHLIHRELFAELAAAGFCIAPGDLGENVTTEGIDLLGLPRGARLRIGATAVVELTGLRNPCGQLDALQQGLMSAMLGRDKNGGLVRKSGVMGIVVADGEVRPGDATIVTMPPPPHERLERV